MQRQERFNKADKIIRVGLWASAVLMVMKLLAGHFGRSEAVFADGMESACDLVAIFSSIVALRIGRKPFDEKHPYGHGKAESISAILISLVIFGTGAGILYQAVTTIVFANNDRPQIIAVVAALATVAIKEWLYRFTMITGADLQSPTLLAIAKDHRKDAMTSIATVVGVVAAFMGFKVMDPLAAGLTSFFIFNIGYDTFRNAAHELMDAVPEEEMLTAITRMAEAVEGVEHVHEIRARRSGQFIIVDLKLEMDPEMTVKRSHDIATEVKRLIFENFMNVGDVMIHINPHDEDHEDLIRL